MDEPDEADDRKHDRVADEQTNRSYARVEDDGRDGGNDDEGDRQHQRRIEMPDEPGGKRREERAEADEVDHVSDPLREPSGEPCIPGDERGRKDSDGHGEQRNGRSGLVALDEKIGVAVDQREDGLADSVCPDRSEVQEPNAVPGKGQAHAGCAWYSALVPDDSSSDSAIRKLAPSSVSKVSRA